jgi:hypothetical protein
LPVRRHGCSLKLRGIIARFVRWTLYKKEYSQQPYSFSGEAEDEYQEQYEAIENQ